MRCDKQLSTHNVYGNKFFFVVCGAKLDFVTASLHLGQTDIAEFIEKSIWFNSEKHSDTQFAVTRVMTKADFRKLKQIRSKSFFCKECYTGNLFFIVGLKGNAYRCYDMMKDGYLGNIVKGTFERYSGFAPCLALK